MTTSNNKTSITFALLEQIFGARFSLTTTRLLIGMIHLQDLHDLWSTFDDFVKDPGLAKTWARGAELRSIVGPKEANKAAALKTLVADVSAHKLPCGSGLFDSIKMTGNNRILTWQFSPSVHALMALRWQDDFALLDLDHVANRRSIRTLILYCTVRNFRNARIPEFTGSVPSKWSDYRPGLFQSLQQISGMVDTTFFVGLEPVRGAQGEHILRFRLRHPGTTWYPDKIRYWPYGTRVFKISAVESKEIQPRNLPDYSIPNENPAQVEANLRKHLAGSPH